MKRIVNLVLILSFTLFLSGCAFSPVGPGRGLSLLISIIGMFVVAFGIGGLANNSQCDNVNKKLKDVSKPVKEQQDDGD